ncbi:type VI secretion system baseplate subunit TssE [Sagittula sp. M10.9X]|uniref:Type VI secretion system baseplate subunit TssE n=2 Tax=Sagittula salina TaxID=2820268 RepID=A0A940MY66_9RHOB|nr:type VI secretion system baseplate subunit TssE [Sagittula salina]
MQIFRSHHHDRRRRQHAAPTQDAKKEDGETTVTRRIDFREGVNEQQLRHHIEADLNALMNTIRLDAINPLHKAPHVAKSILNYGFRDLSSVTLRELNSDAIRESIRQSLIDYEPRLVPGSIEVSVKRGEGGKDQRMELYVSADLMGDPVDIPMDFDAEVDLGAGKMRMSKLRVQM